MPNFANYQVIAYGICWFKCLEMCTKVSVGWEAAVNSAVTPNRSSSDSGHFDARHRPGTVGQIWPGTE
jgi:hypothetical protein